MRDSDLNFYSIECSGSKKTFVLNQFGPREDTRAIRLFLKTPADGSPPPFDIHFKVTDDLKAQDMDTIIAIPAIQTVGFSQSFVAKYQKDLQDILQFIPCTVWLHDQSKSWPFFVIRFQTHTAFYDRDATRAYQREHGGYMQVYKGSGLGYDFAAHDVDRSYFTFTQKFYDWAQREETGLVMGKRDVLILEAPHASS